VSATRLILLAALSEAEHPRAEEQELSRPTDRRRLDLINEAFDRLGAALGESKKSMNVLDDLIHRARCQTASALSAHASEGGARQR
jgi:hypothetical protein